MNPDDLARALEDLSKDLDLLVYRLERPAPTEATGWATERTAVRRELESLQRRTEDLAQKAR